MKLHDTDEERFVKQTITRKLSNPITKIILFDIKNWLHSSQICWTYRAFIDVNQKESEIFIYLRTYLFTDFSCFFFPNIPNVTYILIIYTKVHIYLLNNYIFCINQITLIISRLVLFWAP